MVSSVVVHLVPRPEPYSVPQPAWMQGFSESNSKSTVKSTVIFKCDPRVAFKTLLIDCATVTQTKKGKPAAKEGNGHRSSFLLFLSTFVMMSLHKRCPAIAF